MLEWNGKVCRDECSFLHILPVRILPFCSVVYIFRPKEKLVANESFLKLSIIGHVQTKSHGNAVSFAFPCDLMITCGLAFLFDLSKDSSRMKTC